MILKANGDYGFMPTSKSKKYGISPVNGKENDKVWPKGEHTFRIVKGEQYNVQKQHPFFEGGDKVSRSQKVSHDLTPSTDKGKGSSG